MNDEDSAISIENKDHLDVPTAATSPPNQPFAISAMERIRLSCTTDDGLGFIWVYTVLLYMFPAPRAPSEIHASCLVYYIINCSDRNLS